MNIYKILILIFLFTVKANAQGYGFNNKVVTDSLLLYIDNNTQEKRSNIGFIRKTIPVNKKRTISIDTCFFYNIISEKPKQSYHNKISLKKTKNNIWKYYLIYDEDCYGYYKLPKDSIALEGYFRMIDNSKPSNDLVKEPDLYNEIDDTGFCGTPELNVVPVKPDSNAEGWFSKGLKNRQWVSTNYFFAKTEEYYVNGIRDGLYIVYNKKDGVLYQNTFENGTGIEKIYRRRGSLYHIKFFKNGTIDFTKPYTIYYENDKLAYKINYSKNLITEYYRNGAIFKTQQIKRKKNKIYKDGLYKGYNKKGLLKQKIYYEYDKQIYNITYDDKGRVEKIESGNMIQYFKKGKLKEFKFFHKDKSN